MKTTCSISIQNRMCFNADEITIDYKSRCMNCHVKYRWNKLSFLKHFIYPSIWSCMQCYILLMFRSIFRRTCSARWKWSKLILNFTFLGSKTINGNVTAAKSISLQISRFKWIDLEQYQLSSRFISTWIDGTKFSGMLFLRFFNHIQKPFKFKRIKIKSANKSANLNTYSNSIFIQSIIIKDDTLLQQGKV